MRFDNYITEITKVSDEEVNKILDAGFINYKKIVKKLKFWPLRLAALNAGFKDFNLSFMINDYKWINKIYKISPDDLASTKKIKGAPIQILVKKRELNDITAKKIRNKIFKNLTHELVHRKQFISMDPEFIKYMSLDNNDITQYFSKKVEIEAYARDAINELKKGNSDIVDAYYYWIQDMSKVLWKRFLKKLYQYQDMYGNNTSKENLLKQLPKLEIKNDNEDEEED